MRRKRWLWVLIFIGTVIALTALTASWNVVLLHQYEKMSLVARQLGREFRGDFDLETPLAWNLTLGGLTILAAFCGMIVFFVRYLRESRYAILQKEFLARISHELKSPVASLDLVGSMLRMEPEDADERERLWQIHEFELHRLKVEIDLLLESSRWETKGFHPRLQSVHLEGWLAEAIRRWSRILGRDAVLVREGDPIECRIETDPRLLDLITNNIVDNARKFARPGTTPRLTVRAALRTPSAAGQGMSWVLEFRDEGMGFDPQAAKKLFRRFFRARNQTSQAVPGTGLGLFLARAAAKTLRLTLLGSSEGEGRGAVFELSGSVSE